LNKKGGILERAPDAIAVIAVALRAPARRRPRPSQPLGQPNPSADREKTRVAITARTQGTLIALGVVGHAAACSAFGYREIDEAAAR
jgi:hypothetical protein